jgi:hypothetical protein
LLWTFKTMIYMAPDSHDESRNSTMNSSDIKIRRRCVLCMFYFRFIQAASLPTSNPSIFRDARPIRPSDTTIKGAAGEEYNAAKYCGRRREFSNAEYLWRPGRENVTPMRRRPRSAPCGIERVMFKLKRSSLYVAHGSGPSGSRLRGRAGRPAGRLAAGSVSV